MQNSYFRLKKYGTVCQQELTGCNSIEQELSIGGAKHPSTSLQHRLVFAQKRHNSTQNAANAVNAGKIQNNLECCQTNPSKLLLWIYNSICTSQGTDMVIFWDNLNIHFTLLPWLRSQNWKCADAVDKQMTRIRAVVISKPYHRKFQKVQKIL